MPSKRRAPEYTALRMTHSGISGLRIATALVAAAEAVAVVSALATTSVAKGHGPTLVDVLAAPLNFVIFAGPALLVLGLASGARTPAALGVAAALAVAFVLGLEIIHVTPWHRADWRARPDDVQTMLFLGAMLGGWPLAALGFLVSRALNRTRDDDAL
jgi:hypothetical protein